MAINDVLSSEEVDALLHGMESGEIAPEDAPEYPRGEVETYNFSSQEHIVRGPLPTLEMIYERFSRHLRTSLYGLLRRGAEISLNRVESLKFADYVQTLPTPAGLHLAHIHPLNGTALFLLEPQLVFLLVDGFFGGGARPLGATESRELTPAEQRVTHIVLHQAYQDLAQAWTPVLKVQLEHKKAETNPQFVNIASPSEPVLVARFRLNFGDNGGELHIAIPYSMIEPIKEVLDGGMQSDRAELDRHWTENLNQCLHDVKVELQGSLVDTELALRDILQLKAGDVIRVELPEQIPLYVEGTPLFRGAFGVCRGKNSVKITESVLVGRSQEPIGTTQNRQ